MMIRCFTPGGAARLTALPILLGALLAISLSAPTRAEAQRQRPPNFVVLFADDLGYGDLPSYGHPAIRTPNLDRMASEGMRLTSFYASSSVCTPSRAGLLTGRYAPRMGLTNAIGPGSPLGIPDAEVTLAEALREQGYGTAMIGKWHLGDTPGFNPLEHGFDRYFGLPYSNDYMPPWVAGAPPVPLYRDREVIERPVVQPPLTRRFTEEAVRFIHDSADEPFFLYLAYTMPHLPISTSEPFRGHSRAGLYGDVVEELDWSVGEILGALREQGVDDRTLVIFTSDNGPWLNPPPRMLQGGVNPWDVGSPGPLRGAKATTFEGGFRVPAIARWPGRIPAGAVSAEPAMNIDFFPTFVRLAGGTLPADRALDGRDILPLLTGRMSAGADEREFFYFAGNDLQAMRSGRWKLRLAVGDDPLELHDLEKDVSERYDVSAAHPEVVERLRRRMDELAEQVHSDAAPAAGGPRAGRPAPGKLASPPQSAVNAAIREPLTRHHRDLPGGAHTNTGHRDEAPVLLAAAAFAGNESADARLLEQMRYTLVGGNDITANGGYPAQHDRHVAAMYAIARLTPRIWGRLTAAERRKIDLLMEAALVSNAFTTSDRNPFVLAGTQQYTLDGDDNVNRDWNPNYREGMAGGLLVGLVYFGGPEAARAVLNGYDHDAFVESLRQAGLTNILDTFTWKARHPESGAPSGEMIERAIRDYRYRDLPLGDYMGIYAALTEDTYGRRVTCGLEDGRGVLLPDGSRAGMLLSGCEDLPNRGQMGMLKELDSVDAGGPRSSTTYAYSGFRVNLVNQYVLVAGGFWSPQEERARLALERVRVGAADLWYKLDHGYRNYSKGRASGVAREGAAGHGYDLSRPLWEGVLLPYHEQPGNR